MTRDGIALSFDLQSEWCSAMDAPLTARLLEVAAADVRSGGPVATIVDGFPIDPVDAALPLRFMGGVHRLALMGLAPRLAAHFPSVGGTVDPSRLVDDFLATVAEHPGYLRDALSVAPQTNDIGRSAALLPAIAVALGGRRLRIRLLEIGAAAGLNLLLDHFRYDLGVWSWGPSDGRPSIEGAWRGDRPQIPDVLPIRERRGCDVEPIDTSSAEERLRLLSFVWPDQPLRFARLEAAIGIAEREAPAVDRADAGSWLVERLAEDPGRRTLTVVAHSCVWQYLPDATRREVTEAIDRHGAAATARRPLAHVSFEPDHARHAGHGFMIDVTTWPGGDHRRLGFGHPHGAWIDWSA